jgi:capsular polysaccharide biosynthesis protein
MRRDFQIVHVQHMLGHLPGCPPALGDQNRFEALSGRFTYRAIVPRLPLDPNSAFLVGNEVDTAEIRRAWAQLNHDDVFIPAGEIRLRDFVVYGSNQLLLSPDESVCLVGGAVNWGVEYARDFISAQFGGAAGLQWSSDRNAFSMEFPSEIPVTARPSILMGSPGHDIYGHWLLDYAPRMLLLKLMGVQPSEHYVFPPLKEWAKQIAAVMGVALNKVACEASPGFTRYRSCRMPSGTKEGFRLSNPVNHLGWQWLRENVMRLTDSAVDISRSGLGERIFVSRKYWGGDRTIINAECLETIAVSRGYDVVRPEEFELPAQARIFQRARLVVGEDGSGLHNIMFAEPGCVLGVIGVPDRINLWHMGICQTLGHRVAYIHAEIDENGVRRVDEAKFASLLDEIQHAADTLLPRNPVSPQPANFREPPISEPELTELPKDFNPRGYLELNRDVAEANLDPATHYVRYGRRERRRWRL